MSSAIDEIRSVQALVAGLRKQAFQPMMDPQPAQGAPQPAPQPAQGAPQPAPAPQGAPPQAAPQPGDPSQGQPDPSQAPGPASPDPTQQSQSIPPEVEQAIAQNMDSLDQLTNTAKHDQTQIEMLGKKVTEMAAHHEGHKQQLQEMNSQLQQALSKIQELEQAINSQPDMPAMMQQMAGGQQAGYQVGQQQASQDAAATQAQQPPQAQQAQQPQQAQMPQPMGV
jgi:hypothetical protein